MEKRDKENNTNTQIVDSNEGERISLSRNKDSGRSPSLDLIDSSKASEDELIKYLAEILVEGFLWLHSNDADSEQQKSSDLL